MIGVFLCLMAAGVALAQAISNPRQVTLRWLRLGGLIAVTLLAVGGATAVWTGQHFTIRVASGLAVGGLLVVAQLMAVQLNWRLAQRVLAAAAFIVLAASLVVAMSTNAAIAAQTDEAVDGGATAGPFALSLALSLPLSAGLLGGFLMTMLLGHAYLTAGGEMTQKPFVRLVVMLGTLLFLRTCVSVGVGLVPWWVAYRGASMEEMWVTMMLIARYAVGLVVPGFFIYMTYDCVRRRANQSATGILYVGGVLVIIGEGIALALVGIMGRTF